LGLLSLAAALDLRHTPRQVLLAGLGVLAGLAASVRSGTCGCWLALAPARLLLLRYARALDGARVRALLAAGVGLLGAAWFVPALGVQQRFVQGIVDARVWYAGGNVWTNVGTRLELWKGAAMLIAEHPLFGMDFAACRARLAEY